MKSAMIAMSGGVDSSVAALFMVGRGFKCFGVTLKLFDAEDSCGRCCSADDAMAAKSVCSSLGISHSVFNYKELFENEVINRFVESYLEGKTPNPCIDCNRFVKFSALLSRAVSLGADFLVTGHYARIERDSSNSRFLLKRAADRTKDQSYVLYFLTQEQLAKVVFPLGEMSKKQIRKVAAEHNFVNADKAESQDICFVSSGKYHDFISQRAAERCRPASFVDCNGNVLAPSKGIINYTIGQRRGIGVSFNRPMFVISKSAAQNTVTLGDESLLYKHRVLISNFNFIPFDTLQGTLNVEMSTRYNEPTTKAVISMYDESHIIADCCTPVRAVSPGQAAVLFQGDIVIGGGTICDFSSH